MSRLRQLIESGVLVQVAGQCQTARELADRLGFGSAQTLTKQLRTLRSVGYPAPVLDEILGRPPRNAGGSQPARSGELVVDQWDEPTHPGSYPMHAIEVEPAPPDPVEEHRLKRQVRELEERNRALMDELLNTRSLLGVIREAGEHKVEPLRPRELRSGLREGCSLVALSDTHVDESVEAASVNGLNEHNPDIARRRLARVFEGARWLTGHARQSHLVRDMVLWLGGDMVSGTIHDDLRETNAMGLPESVAFAHQLIADGIRYLLADEEIVSLRVICSTGNHGRLAPGKPRIHTRNETNIETLLYLGLAREFLADPRVSFDLPTGVFSYVGVYDKVIRFSHGDSFKYGGALAGIWNSINKGIARLNQARTADLDVVGHWHTYTDSPRLITNGSTVGYGTFSEWIHAPFERPQQAWTLLDSRRWRSLSAPVWCDDLDEQEQAA